jgi:two-component system chemotaxis sensor kinase CheA
MLSESEMDEVVSEFLVESHENLDRLDQDLIALENDPTQSALLASVFRTIHTIKGTCGFLGYTNLERVTHVGENLLSRLRDGQLTLDSEMMTGLLDMVDAVREMLREIETAGSDGDESHDELLDNLEHLQDPNRSASTADAPLVGEILVDDGAVELEDVVVALAEQDLGDDRLLGEILVDHGSTDPASVEDAVRRQGDGAEIRPGRADSTIRVDVDVLDRLMNLVGELVLARNNMLQHLGTAPAPSMLTAAQRLDLVTGELQESVMKTRMQPIGSAWAKFPRIVRDLSLSFKKQVAIETEGEETELDKTIIEAIKDPLTHVVRNAVDHGIESPEVREAAGKPRQGTLKMKAYHEGGQVIIEISDDGAGIDIAKVKAKAVSKELITPAQSAAMTDREAMQLIFAPGFSTAAAVTNVSGRGVGMDVVKTNVEKIGGTVEVSSELGLGTSLRVRIPLTLAIIPALLVLGDGDRYAIAQRDVVELVRLDGARSRAGVEHVHGALVYRLRGRLLPLVDIRDVLDLSEREDSETMTIVVLSADGQQFGLVVDAVVTTEEIVVKPLGRLINEVTTFSGATIMGDGRVALILDVAGIARSSQAVAAARAEADTSSDAALATSTTVPLLVAATEGEGRVAIPLADVARLEEVPVRNLERAGGRDVVQYRGAILPLLSVGSLVGHGGYVGGDPDGVVDVIVHDWKGCQVGLVVSSIVDIVEADLPEHRSGPTTTFVVSDRVTELLDVEQLLESHIGSLFDDLLEVMA